jgi:peptidoglycan hydrolase-like protein with peptidoglycan-binding domain
LPHLAKVLPAPADATRWPLPGGRSPPSEQVFFVHFPLRSTIVTVTVATLGAAVLTVGSPAGATPPTLDPAAGTVAARPGIADPGGPPPPDTREALPARPAARRTSRAAGPAGAAAAVPVPPTPPGLPSAVEPLSPYLGQVSCDFREKPGVRAFADLVLRTYPATSSAGILRSCLTGATSEHKEGRAWDWWVSVTNPAEVAEANALITWLLATDAAGNRFAMARRLGLMYLIWNAQSWSTYRAAEGWRPYSCSGTTGCHRDHVHFSFGWAGAWQRTSYFTKQVAPVDYGPCRPAGQRNAPVYSRFSATACSSVATPATPRSDLEFLEQNLNLAAVSGDSGSAVSVVQRQVGTAVTGSFGGNTVAAVGAYQRAHALPQTGWVGGLTWRAFLAGALRAMAKRVGDYNGDGRADPAVFRPATATWYVHGMAASAWGARGDIPVPGDYNGDGRSDLAVYRPSTRTWWIRGGVTTAWGLAGDVPVPADYNGDGRTDLAVFRPSNGTWYIAGGPATTWGVPGDVPVPADYNGDGRVELAVFRPSNGRWYVGSAVSTPWGESGDVPVPGDYNGDGRVELAVFRPSTGAWWVRGGATTPWGQRGDVPSPADYNGDHRADLAVFRPSTGAWGVRGSATTAWGLAGDVPLMLPFAIARAVVSFG